LDALLPLRNSIGSYYGFREAWMNHWGHSATVCREAKGKDWRWHALFCSSQRF
jgi:hypothetical protein